MGKHQKFKAREKSFQKMTRDGLIQENHSTGEVEHIGKRHAEQDFHHETELSEDYSAKRHTASPPQNHASHRSQRMERSTSVHQDIPTEPFITSPDYSDTSYPEVIPSPPILTEKQSPVFTPSSQSTVENTQTPHTSPVSEHPTNHRQYHLAEYSAFEHPHTKQNAVLSEESQSFPPAVPSESIVSDTHDSPVFSETTTFPEMPVFSETSVSSSERPVSTVYTTHQRNHIAQYAKATAEQHIHHKAPQHSFSESHHSYQERPTAQNVYQEHPEKPKPYPETSPKRKQTFSENSAHRPDMTVQPDCSHSTDSASSQTFHSEKSLGLTDTFSSSFHEEAASHSPKALPETEYKVSSVFEHEAFQNKSSPKAPDSKINFHHPSEITDSKAETFSPDSHVPVFHEKHERPPIENGVVINHRQERHQISKETQQFRSPPKKPEYHVPDLTSHTKSDLSSDFAGQVSAKESEHLKSRFQTKPQSCSSLKTDSSTASPLQMEHSSIVPTAKKEEPCTKPADNGITHSHRQTKPIKTDSSDKTLHLAAGKSQKETPTHTPDQSLHLAQEVSAKPKKAITPVSSRANNFSEKPVPKEVTTSSKSSKRTVEHPVCSSEKKKPNSQTTVKSTIRESTASKKATSEKVKSEKPNTAKKKNTSKKEAKFQEKAEEKVPKSRLKFETSDLDGKAGIKGTIKKGSVKTAKSVTRVVSTGVHGKLHDSEQDNSAVESAHRAELFMEHGIVKISHSAKKHRDKKRTAKRNSLFQEIPDTNHSRLRTGTPVPPPKQESKKGLLNHFYQKLQNKKRAEAAVKNAKKGTRSVEKAAKTTTTFAERSIHAVKQFFTNHKHTIYVCLALVLILIVLLTQVQSCASMAAGSLSAVTASSWPAEDSELTKADLYYTQLEADLQKQIDSIESNHPNCDEYNYNIGAIGHDPVALISYLCAKYGSFTFNRQIKNELNSLFASQYNLNINIQNETRSVTRTVHAGDSLGTVVTSGYCNCSVCCGQWAGGPTASGVYPQADHTIAVDANNPTVPMGTEIIMNGHLYKVEDTGNFDRYGVDFDVYCADHATASAWGHQSFEAFYAGGDGEEIQIVTTETVKVCYATLTSHSLELLINSRMDSEQQELFSVYQSTRGNRQFLGTPLACNWYGNVSSLYGYRILPTSGAVQLHRGLDIAVPQGTEILAAHDGTVVTATTDSSYGKYIVIENDDGYTTKYAHCSSLSVSVGQEVTKGDVIAAVGSTGNSTGPHLHIEFLYEGEYLNPYFYLGIGEGTLPGSGIITVFPGDVDALNDAQFRTLIREAERYLGMPYVWGGSSPSTGFDCSGFVSYVFTNSGIYNMGRLTAQGIFDICSPVSPSDAKPGDIIFFTGTYNSGCPVSHVGIYVGNNQMIHCGDPIQYTSINSSYWQSHFYAFARVR